MWPFSGKKRRRWVEMTERVNQALAHLEGEGVPLKGARYPLPPRILWALNDKVEARLVELGVPADLHGAVIAFMSGAFAGEIRDKTIALANKSGLDPDDEAGIDALSRGVTLAVCCRRIGLEASPEEIRRTVKYAQSMASPGREPGAMEE